ncbi:MAG TPA: NAD(P)H-dependent oxidoreductase [Syntrophomonadaceae bacterium]|nr:NAD(P)H-dependent oxidoreductase [Syntrophomonadaceae bacterium]
MKNIVLINASPKVNEPSTSEYLVDAIGKHIDDATTNKFFINVRHSIAKHKTREDFETIFNADAVIIAFPLYIFCMPGILTRFLEDYYKFYIERGEATSNVKVYAIVNCGFPEPEINLEAIRVIKSFCYHINAHFRFGILIGGGGMLHGAKDAPFMKKTLTNLNDAFLTIAKDIENVELNKLENLSIAVNFPRRLFFFMGNRNWYAWARRNGLKKKDLYRKPYR